MPGDHWYLLILNVYELGLTSDLPEKVEYTQLSVTEIGNDQTGLEDV